MNSRKKIEELEAEIQSQATNIREMLKKLAALDLQILQAVQKAVDNPKTAHEQDKLIKKLSLQEQEEYKLYIAVRKLNEDTVRTLRKEYAAAIRDYHEQKKNAKNSSPLDLSTSQLLSFTGSTTAGRTNEEEEDILFFQKGSGWLTDKEITITSKQPEGKGTWANVFKGLCRGKDVAVKVLTQQNLNEKALEQFKQECSTLKSIVGHPNLLLFMGACLEEGKYKLVLEYAPNGSLEKIIGDKKVKLSFNRKIKILSGVASGMNWLHQRDPPLLHLNLKPSNLLLTANWHVKISDYGLGSVTAASRPTQLNSAAYFAAPEFFAGNPTVKSDVYSFGLLCWYLIAEKKPFEEFTDFAKLVSHVNGGGRPAIQPNMTNLFKALTEKCWASNADNRPNFADILGENTWDDMIMEAVTGGEQKAKDFWKSLGTPQEQTPEKIQWTTFAKGFGDFLGLQFKDDSIQLKCLKAVLDVDKGPQKGVVTLLNFERFLSWFGPVRTGKSEGEAFMASIVNLLKQEWFHGQVDGPTAGKRIIASQKKSGFLIRFSTTDKTYTMTFRDKKTKQVANSRLDKKYMKDICSYIEKVIKKYSLEPVGYEREYAPLFNSPKQVTHVSGYSTMVGVDGQVLPEISDLMLNSLSDTIEFAQ